jgi:hypothetical protein
MPCPSAHQIVHSALVLRHMHAHAPVPDLLDMVMQGHVGQSLAFGDAGDPPHAFALLVAAAFDDVMTSQE